MYIARLDDHFHICRMCRCLVLGETLKNASDVTDKRSRDQVCCWHLPGQQFLPLLDTICQTAAVGHSWAQLAIVGHSWQCANVT